MARPIAETPHLKGKAAKIFLDDVRKNAHKRATKEEKERIKKNYEMIKSIARFEWS
ncbi:hypothetical protein [Chitinophaga sp. Cy-1792]|uniref:hypothetical protein n=1 Tax=Chitinophaga sp. Cy-1792 TaxID=2608339 RepID=UPI001420FE30|nr:hypothetical protein [Chitinophaga sp. Cy-1792]